MENTIDIENSEQILAHNLIENTNSSFFLTGRAGTGKTTFLKTIQKLVNKRFITIAPTGIAAINAGGETIHSFFRFPLRVLNSTDKGSLTEEKKQIILNSDTIIIDEVSMVRCDIIDALDRTLRAYCMNPMPFGGKQIIFTGDMFQLEPILSTVEEKEMIMQQYETDKPYFFKAKVFERMKLVAIEFSKIYRQSDPVFINILERIRNKQTTDVDLKTLNTRVCECEDVNKMIITLTSHNATAKGINDMNLSKIEQKEFTYTAQIAGEYKEKYYPTENELKLKVGAQVMFSRNDGSGRWVNGTLGEISALAEDKVVVKIEDGREFTLEPVVWENIKYDYDKKSRSTKKEVIGTFKQYPLKTAWAITIHKSQGLSFDHIRIDLSRGVFADGQTYVALSRARTLEGMYLTHPIKLNFIKTSDEVLAFARDFNNQEDIDFEIQNGKSVNDLIEKKEFDSVAQKLYLNGIEEVRNKNIMGAYRLFNRALDYVICDDCLFGTIDRSIIFQISEVSYEGYFLKAMCNLYSGNTEDGLALIEAYIQIKGVSVNALYIQSRLLTLMDRWEEADNLHDQILELLEGRADSKLYYRGGIINEEKCNIRSLSLFQGLINLAPNTIEIHHRIRHYLRNRNGLLMEQEPSNNPLIDAFNLPLENRTFDTLLTECHKQNNETMNQYLDVVHSQVFD